MAPDRADMRRMRTDLVKLVFPYHVHPLPPGTRSRRGVWVGIDNESDQVP